MSEQPLTAEPPLDPNAILVAEFEYIAQSAYQANEDRARVSNYYLVSTGATVAAVLSMLQAAPPSQATYWAFVVIFAVLSVAGLITLLQIARLRAAWTDSLRAMNRIKDYYAARRPDAQLGEAFAWTTATIPRAGKRQSVAFLLALAVVLVDAPMAAASIFFAGLALGAQGLDPVWLGISVAGGALFAAVQFRWYANWLKG